MNFDTAKRNILRILQRATKPMLASNIRSMLSRDDITIVSVGRNLGLMSKQGWVADRISTPGTPGQWSITELGKNALGEPLDAFPMFFTPCQRLLELEESNRGWKKAVAELEATVLQLADDLSGQGTRIFIAEQAAEAQMKTTRELRRDLNETDQFARTHSHKSSLTTMTHEAKAGGAKQILISL